MNSASSRHLDRVTKAALCACALVLLGGAAPVDSAPDNKADTTDGCDVIVDDKGVTLPDCHVGTTVTGTRPPAGSPFNWWAGFGTGWDLFIGFSAAAPTPAQRAVEHGLDKLEQEADKVRKACIDVAVKAEIAALAAVEAMRVDQISAEVAAYRALWAEEDEFYRDMLDGCGGYAPCIDTVTTNHNQATAELNADYDLGLKIARDTAAEEQAAAIKAAEAAITKCEESGI